MEVLLIKSVKRQPICYIIAGPNGAGKTTFALQYLPKIVSCNNFINADEIAKGVSPLNFEASLLQASKIFLQALNKKNFAFETTLFWTLIFNKNTRVAKRWMENCFNLPLHSQC